MAGKDLNGGLVDVVTITIDKMDAKLEMGWNTGIHIFVWGQPGIAKSAKAEQWAKKKSKELGLEFVRNPKLADFQDPKKLCFVVVNGSALDELQANGVPVVDEIDTDNGTKMKVTRLSPTLMFPSKAYTKSKVVLFFDELSNSQTRVLAALQPMFVDGCYGIEHTLACDLMIAASNRPNDGSFVTLMGMAGRNRWYHCNVLPIDNPGEWCDVMREIGRQLNPALDGFLRTPMGNKFYNTFTGDMKSGKFAFATPRTLEMASKTLNYHTENGAFPEQDIREDVGGCIGKTAGDQLVDFLKLAKAIDMDTLVKNPNMISQYNSDLSTLYSIMLALSSNRTQKYMDSAYEMILKHMPKKEFGAFYLNALLHNLGKTNWIKMTNQSPLGKTVATTYDKLITCY